MKGNERLTATNVAGRKIDVTAAIVFIAVLSRFELLAIRDAARLKYLR